MNEEDDFGVVHTDRMTGSDPAEFFALKQQLSSARAVLKAMPFVASVERAWFGGGVGGVFAVFLVSFVDTETSDQGLVYSWVAVGDVPWFVTLAEKGDRPVDIARRYVASVRSWVANNGEEPEDCFIGPKYLPKRNKELLERVSFIEKSILQFF